MLFHVEETEKNISQFKDLLEEYNLTSRGLIMLVSVTFRCESLKSYAIVPLSLGMQTDCNDAGERPRANMGPLLCP